MQNIILSKKKKVRKFFFFNKIIKLRANIQNKTKLLTFSKKKWEISKKIYARKFKWYQKYKINDQSIYLAIKYATTGNKYVHYYRNSKNHSKNLQLLYGIASKRKLKNLLKYFKSKKKFRLNLLEILKIMESRLDSVLLRSKFAKSIRDSQQLILHGKILVNKKVVKSPCYYLKAWDTISLKPCDYYLITENLKYYYKNWKFRRKSGIWPHPPKHFLTNYTTLQIIFGVANFHSVSAGLFYYLNLDKIINKSYYN